MVRSPTGLMMMARTSDIGLRREPQPPMPMVMPSRSSAANSSWVVRLSATPGPLVDERRAGLATGAGQGQLVGEALLVPIAAVDVDRIDAVERLLGGADGAR